MINKSPQCFIPSSNSIGLSDKEKKQKIDFQDGSCGGNLGFSIEMVLAIFDLQVTLMLPTKFQANWPSGFSYFWSTKKYEESPGSATSTNRSPSQTPEEEKTDKTKQAQIEQTYEKH